jgi:hypothetical protein
MISDDHDRFARWSATAGFPQVVTLDYSRQGITSVRARLLSGVLRANGTLTSLDLYRQAS